MVSLADLERPPVRAALAILILLELYLILTRYRSHFDDFVSFTLLLLALPFAYFAYHLLAAKLHPVKTYEAIVRSGLPRDASEETREQVDKLLASKEYQEYERRRQESLRRRQEGEEELDE